MPLLPYLRCELASSKTPSEVEEAMRAAVEPKQFLRVGGATRPFEGVVGDRAFNVRRIIGYRNSFRPEIRGEISAAPDGSRIAITMSLHPVVLVFMIVWLGGVGVGCVAMLMHANRKGGTAVQVLGPAGLFAFGWLLSAGGFTFEARKAQALLAHTMQAR
jgi:hypothetical protein